MERKNGPWTIKKTESVFKNSFLELFNDKVTQPDGSDGEYATVHLKPGACVLPIDDDGNVYLTRQFRYALGAESLETPCGAIEDDGEPLDADKARNKRRTRNRSRPVD